MINIGEHVHMCLQRKSSGYYEAGVFCPAVHGAWLWKKLKSRNKANAIIESNKEYVDLLIKLLGMVHKRAG